MPPDEAGLMAAVNAGIADAAPSAPAPTMASPTPPAPDTTPEKPDEPQEPAASAGSEGETAPAGTGAPSGESLPADAAAGTGDAAQPAEGAASGDQPAADGVQKPVADDAEKPLGVGEDPLQHALNAPLPNALKKETKERIQTLAGKVKELMPKLEEVTRDRDMMVEMVQQTGATVQQYQQALGYLSLVNSPSRADREKALEIMQAEISVLSRSLGKPVPGVNMLEGHTDLIQEVGQGRLSPERAAEIAAARESQRMQRQGSERLDQQRRQQDETQRALTDGKAALNTLESRLRSDPNYPAKREILVKQLKPVFAKLHPSQWAEAFEQAYNALPAPVAPRPTPTPTPNSASPANGGGNTPLRASNPAGGAPRAAPKNMAEAIEFGIRDAR